MELYKEAHSYSFSNDKTDYPANVLPKKQWLMFLI